MENISKASLRLKIFLNKKIFGKLKIKLFVGGFVGILVGFLYFHFFGCNNGCAIKSNPYAMISIGFIGGLILSSDI